METPLLKKPDNKVDQTSPANYGSNGNGQDPGTAVTNTKANITGRKHDKITENGQAASPAGGKDVMIAVNPKEAYRAKLRCKCYRLGTNIAQGMLNFALLSANISQFMTALDGGYPQFCFVLLVIVISLSIILQIVAGALMFYAATLDMNNDQLHEKYDILVMAVTGLAWLVAAFNLMILVFGRQDYTFTSRLYQFD